MDYRVNGEGDVIIVRWLDNGVVQLVSTLVGIELKGTVNRWSDRIQQHIEIKRPCLIEIYNDNMGGVDKLDHLIALYRIKTRTKKWTVKLIFHFVDFALVNAWLEYRRAAELCDPSSKYMDLLEFRSQVAEALMKTTPLTLPVGRPRMDDSVDDDPAAKRPYIRRSINDVRYDRVDHLPIHVDALGQRCKIEKYRGRSRIKCGVHLCLSKENNCFIAYHQK